MVPTTASDVLIDTINDGGVEIIFGLPGDGINDDAGSIGVRTP